MRHAVNDPYRATKRILWIISKLENQQVFNCTDICCEFDVFPRTAHRDMRFVREHVYPDRVVFDRGKLSFILR